MHIKLVLLCLHCYSVGGGGEAAHVMPSSRGGERYTLVHAASKLFRHFAYLCHARSVNLRNLTKSRSQIKDPYIAALFIDALLKRVILHSIH